MTRRRDVVTGYPWPPHVRGDGDSVNGDNLTPEQYEMLFGEPPPASPQSAPPPPPPPLSMRQADDRLPEKNWWKKKRFALPMLFGVGGFVGLILLAVVFVAIGNDPDEPQMVATEGDAAVAVKEPLSQDVDTIVLGETGSAPTTSSSTTTAQTEPAEAQPAKPAGPTLSILERPVSAEELAIAMEALAAATVVDELVAPVPYRRAEYADGWGDADGDCFSDRHEILLERSEVPTETADCKVTTGQWTDPYDGEVYTDARTITIDHFVPLAAAHRAGAWAWDIETKRAFAADITYRPSHVTAGQATNEEKGDKEPHLWRPELEAWCGYAIDWVSVKTRWALDYSTDEATAISEMLGTCEVTNNAPTATSIPLADPTASTTTSSTTTTIATTAGEAQVEVSSCDARGETVELINRGGEAITLTGWVLHDQGRKHETTLSNVTLEPGGRIVMLSGQDTPDAEGTMRWSNQNVWNNDGDEATLLKRNGEVVGSLRCRA